MPEVFLHAREHKDLTTGEVDREIGIEVFFRLTGYLNVTQTEYLIDELNKALTQLKSIESKIA